jgi:hypothetical protein
MSNQYHIKVTNTLNPDYNNYQGPLQPNFNIKRKRHNSVSSYRYGYDSQNILPHGKV